MCGALEHLVSTNVPLLTFGTSLQCIVIAVCGKKTDLFFKQGKWFCKKRYKFVLAPNGRREAVLKEMSIIKITVHIGEGRWQLV